jgi:hypothetical protein
MKASVSGGVGVGDRSKIRPPWPDLDSLAEIQGKIDSRVQLEVLSFQTQRSQPSVGRRALLATTCVKRRSREASARFTPVLQLQKRFTNTLTLPALPRTQRECLPNLLPNDEKFCGLEFRGTPLRNVRATTFLLLDTDNSGVNIS